MKNTYIMTVVISSNYEDDVDRFLALSQQISGKDFNLDGELCSTALDYSDMKQPFTEVLDEALNKHKDALSRL